MLFNTLFSISMALVTYHNREWTTIIRTANQQYKNLIFCNQQINWLNRGERSKTSFLLSLMEPLSLLRTYPFQPPPATTISALQLLWQTLPASCCGNVIPFSLLKPLSFPPPHLVADVAAFAHQLRQTYHWHAHRQLSLSLTHQPGLSRFRFPALINPLDSSPIIQLNTIFPKFLQTSLISNSSPNYHNNPPNLSSC